MSKNAIVHARIDSDLKNQAENILHKIGLSSAEAIRLFYNQISLHNGLPFEVKIPNATTLKAMHDADIRKTHKAKSVDDLFSELDE